jgi:hypothetical protein
VPVRRDLTACVPSGHPPDSPVLWPTHTLDRAQSLRNTRPFCRFGITMTFMSDLVQSSSLKSYKTFFIGSFH